MLNEKDDVLVQLQQRHDEILEESETNKLALDEMKNELEQIKLATAEKDTANHSLKLKYDDLDTELTTVMKQNAKLQQDAENNIEKLRQETKEKAENDSAQIDELQSKYDA